MAHVVGGGEAGGALESGVLEELEPLVVQDGGLLAHGPGLGSGSDDPNVGSKLYT